jgi:hypothetical protein
MENPIYYLSEEQKSFARMQAKLRNDAKPLAIRHKFRRSNHSPEEAHVIGIAGEIVYADVVNEAIDIKVHAHGDEVDFIGREMRMSTFRGKQIEIKVPVAEFEKKKPEVYILGRTSPDISYVEFIGCITREKFEKVKYIKNYGHGDNYCVSEHQLSKSLPVMIKGQIKYISFDMVKKIIKSKKANM